MRWPLLAAVLLAVAAAVSTPASAVAPGGLDTALPEPRLEQLEAAVAQQERVLEGEQRLIAALAQRHAALENRTHSLRRRLEIERRHRGVLLGEELNHSQAPSTVAGELHQSGLRAKNVRSLSFSSVLVEGWKKDVETVILTHALAALTGLKASIPLVVELIAKKLSGDQFVIQLREEYAWMDSWVFLTVLIVFAVLEVAGDAIPVIDELLDFPMVAVKPGLAMLLSLSAKTSEPTDVRITMALAAGINCLGVVLSKQAWTMLVDVATGGTGAPIRCAVEVLVAVAGSILSILFPIVAPFIILVSIIVACGCCFTRQGRESSKSAPYLASLCLWPERDSKG